MSLARCLSITYCICISTCKILLYIYFIIYIICYYICTLFINKHSYIVLKLTFFHWRSSVQEMWRSWHEGTYKPLPMLQKVIRHISTFTLQVQVRISGLCPAGVCLQEYELSASPAMCFSTILNHKGPEAWDSVCFGLVPITRDHKDTLQGHVNSFYSLSVPRFIRECSLKKGHFRKANVALSWSVSVDKLRWMWAQLLSVSHWHGNISRFLGHKHWAFLNKSMN